MGITERTTVIRRRRTLAAILAAKYRDPARLLTVQPQDAANENEAAETATFGIAARGGRVRHLVYGSLDALAREDAWRKAETTLCGRSLVPINYYTDARATCAQCIAADAIDYDVAAPFVGCGECEAAETTRVYGCLHSTFDEHDRCVECGAAEVPGPSSVSVPWPENCMDLHGDDRTRTPHRHVEGGPGRPISGPSSVSSADVVWSWDHTAAMGLAEMTNAAMRRIEEAVQR